MTREPGEHSNDQARLPRRTVLAVGAAGAAGLTLAACSSSGDGGGGQASPGAGAAAGNGGSADQVPVGGAAIVSVGDTAFVVAQPTAGNFVAHSAVCPHQGCLCNEVVGPNAVCPCHGSEFDAESGAVKRGPATKPLAPANVTVTDGTLEFT